MNIVEAIGGGLTGTTALSVFQEALHKIDPKAPRPLLHQDTLGKKAKVKKGKKNTAKRHLKTAAGLAYNAIYFSLPVLGKKQNAPLSGSLLGAAAGLWNAFGKKTKGSRKQKPKARQRLYNILFYTTAGFLAGEVIKHVPVKSKKQNGSKREHYEIKERKPLAEVEKKALSTILFIDDVPVGYQIHKEGNELCFEPSQYSAKECCPPKFSILPDGESWLFEPNTLEADLQNQVIQEIMTIDAGKLLG